MKKISYRLMVIAGLFGALLPMSTVLIGMNKPDLTGVQKAVIKRLLDDQFYDYPIENCPIENITDELLSVYSGFINDTTRERLTTERSKRNLSDDDEMLLPSYWHCEGGELDQYWRCVDYIVKEEQRRKRVR